MDDIKKEALESLIGRRQQKRREEFAKGKSDLHGMNTRVVPLEGPLPLSPLQVPHPKTVVGWCEDRTSSRHRAVTFGRNRHRVYSVIVASQGVWQGRAPEIPQHEGPVL